MPLTRKQISRWTGENEVHFISDRFAKWQILSEYHISLVNFPKIKCRWGNWVAYQSTIKFVRSYGPTVLFCNISRQFIYPTIAWSANHTGSILGQSVAPVIPSASSLSIPSLLFTTQKFQVLNFGENMDFSAKTVKLKQNMCPPSVLYGYWFWWASQLLFAKF